MKRLLLSTVVLTLKTLNYQQNHFAPGHHHLQFVPFFEKWARALLEINQFLSSGNKILHNFQENRLHRQWKHNSGCEFLFYVRQELKLHFFNLSEGLYLSISSVIFTPLPQQTLRRGKIVVFILRYFIYPWIQSAMR